MRGIRQPRPTRLLMMILLTFFGLAVTFNLVTPMYEGYDEAHHVSYVEHVVVTGGIPIMPSHLFQAVQPPAYYFLQAAVVRILGLPKAPHALLRLDQDPPVAQFHHGRDEKEAFLFSGRVGTVRILRLMSSLIGTITLLLIFLFVRSLIPERPYVAVGVTATVAFVPQFIFVHSLVNNDSLGLLWSALALVGVVRIARAEDRFSLLIGAGIAGVALGFGLITKDYVIALVPVAFVGLALARVRPSYRLLGAGIVLGIVLALSGWMFARNVSLYGQVLPAEASLENTRRIFPQTIEPRRFTDPVFRGLFLQELRDSFWYSGGGGQLRMAPAVYLALDLVLLVIIFGIERVFLIPERVGLSRGDRRILTLLLLAIALQFAGVVFFNLTYQQFQGRYLFPALPAIALFLVLGGSALLPERFRHVAFAAIPAGLLALSLYALFGVALGAYGL